LIFSIHQSIMSIFCSWEYHAQTMIKSLWNIVSLSIHWTWIHFTICSTHLNMICLQSMENYFNLNLKLKLLNTATSHYLLLFFPYFHITVRSLSVSMYNHPTKLFLRNVDLTIAGNIETMSLKMKNMTVREFAIHNYKH
jgi:hypothetical protein